MVIKEVEKEDESSNSGSIYMPSTTPEKVVVYQMTVICSLGGGINPNKLSRREQILIYILVLLMVVVVGWYFMISTCYGKKLQH